MAGVLDNAVDGVIAPTSSSALAPGGSVLDNAVQSATQGTNFTDQAAPSSPAAPAANFPEIGNQQADFTRGLVGELYNQAKNLAGSIVPPALHGDTSQGAASFLPPAYTQAVKGVEQLPDEYRAYEQARASGKSPLEAFGAASGVTQAKQSTIKALESRIKEFKTDPSKANGKALADLAPVLMSFVGAPGEIDAVAPAEAAPEATAAAEGPAQPSITQKVLQGSDVAQPLVKQAFREGATASAEDAGVADKTLPQTHAQPVRTLLDDPIQNLAETERATYDTLNQAAGTDLKSLVDHAEEVQDALDDPTNIANRSALQTDLKTTQDAIAQGQAQAVKNGVSPDMLTKAQAMTQQRYAMQTLKQKVFNNEAVVKGNLLHGTPEEINVDAAIRNAENLNKPSRFAPEGTPTRLQQALGEDGANNLLKKLYTAQKTGKSAVKVRTAAEWIAGALGGAAAYKAVDMLR